MIKLEDAYERYKHLIDRYCYKHFGYYDEDVQSELKIKMIETINRHLDKKMWQLCILLLQNLDRRAERLYKIKNLEPEYEYQDEFEDPEEDVSTILMRKELEDFLCKTLTPREWKIVKLRCGFRGQQIMPFSQIDVEFGMRNGRSRDVFDRAIRRLKREWRELECYL